MTRQTRTIVFGITCIVAIALPIAYVAFTRRAAPASASTAYVPLTRIKPGERGVLFRSTVPDESFGKVAFVPLAHPESRWLLSNLACDRVYFQHGRGVCEALDSTLLPPYAVFVFDDRFVPGEKRPLAGVPSRARISPDGRYAALTVFQSGHSYAETGFSTATTIHDAATGGALANLEVFKVSREGQEFSAIDFNFWGVTFANDGNRFFATLRTAGVNYLVEGDVAQRSARVIHVGVECPSLSPNNQRIAFKKRISGSTTVFWQIAVLDLQTNKETMVDWEKRSVDDQVDWLDDDEVVYHLPKSEGADIWAVSVDRAEPPRVLIAGGYSPSVVR